MGKLLFLLILTLSTIPVSIATMMWGWGLPAENWGWISFGYLWMIVAPLMADLGK